MTITEVKNSLSEIVTQMTFVYNGKDCGIDPISITEFDMWYGEDFITVNSIDKVMNTALFDGKMLSDIVDDVEDLEL